MEQFPRQEEREGQIRGQKPIFMERERDIVRVWGEKRMRKRDEIAVEVCARGKNNGKGNPGKRTGQQIRMERGAKKKELAINLPSEIVTEKECPVWSVYPMGSSSISQENLQRKGLKILDKSYFLGDFGITFCFRVLYQW